MKRCSSLSPAACLPDPLVPLHLAADRDIKQGIRRNFARRANSYDRHAWVQRLMAQGLLALAEPCLDRADRVLEIGCGTGSLTQLLRKRHPGARLVCLDLDAALVARARARLGLDPRVAWLVADGEALGPARFDLIVANATFQWFRRPGATVAAYYHNLNPGGGLAFSTLGPRTFHELADSCRQAAWELQAAAPEIPATGFLDREAWSAILAGAGFPQVRLAREMVTVAFPSVPRFLKTLQATGSTNPRPRPFSPRLLTALVSLYQARYGLNGTIPATYEIIWAVAQK